MRRCRVPVPAVTVIIAASLGCIFPPGFFGLRGLLVHIPGVTGFGMATMARQISGGNSQPVLLLIPKGGLADTHIQCTGRSADLSP